MDPSFHNPVQVHFGLGVVDRLSDLVGERRCAVITTAGMERRGGLARIRAALGDRLVATYSGVEPNPTVASCRHAFEALAADAVDVVVALGGGSSIDTSKAVAAQCTQAGSPDWLARHLRAGDPFPTPFRPPPIIAVPTTAGTGSEVTMWATIWDELSSGKHSLSHPALYPEVALVDPELTTSVPHETTVASALDALSHAMEAVWNRAANPVSDALALRAIATIPPALPRALEAPADVPARWQLSSAALLAGLAISGTRTALAHSISYPLTAELGVPHGVACSVTLPELMLAVDDRVPERAGLIVEALRARSVDDAARRVYALLADTGAAGTLRRHVPDAAALRGLRGGFIAPGRAENFVLDVSQEWAADLLERAYLALS